MKSTGTEDIAYSSRSKHQAKIRKNVVFNNSVITVTDLFIFLESAK